MYKIGIDDVVEKEYKGNLPFSAVFFRLYDRKIASGEITFSSLKMSKAEFTAMCMNSEYVPEIQNILELCNKMKLETKEAESLINAAGYGFREKNG